MEQVCKVVIGEDLHQIQQHGSYAFPLQVYLDDFALLGPEQVPWHWHEELEFGVMLRGSVQADITECGFTIEEGQGFFVNSNILHRMHSQGQDTLFFNVVFAPRLLFGHMGSAIGQKYIKPVLECAALRLMALDTGMQWQKQVMEHLTEIRHLCNAKKDGYEMAVTAELYTMWQALYAGCAQHFDEPVSPLVEKDETRIKQLMDFIHGNYADSISLEDIAAAANISVSECCRSFKRALGTTPFGYLNQYRLSLAAELLRGGHSATEAFKQAGFCSQSYFGKQFKGVYGCTPGQYRKKYTA